MGPGLIQGGLGLYGANRQSQQAEDRLRRAQGPLYDQQQRLAGDSLNLAQNMDPKAMAAERFATQQALVAPGNEAARLELMRKLQKQGLLGAASFAPVAGTVATPGVPINPQMAALFAAQEGAKAQASYGSLKEGNDYLSQLLGNAGMLQRGAQDARSTGQRAMDQIPRKVSVMDQVVKQGGNILKDKQGRDAILAAIKSAPEFVRNLPTSIPGMFGDLSEWLNPSGLSDTDWGF
jgi:hypothetical protein